MHRAEARHTLPSNDVDLLCRYGRLIDASARRLATRIGLPHLFDDLWSVGAMGLLEAAQRFDAARDVRFETFIEHRIQGAMLDELRKMDHLPRRLRSNTEKVDKARAALSRQFGREPSSEELAADLDLSISQLTELEQLRQPLLPLVEALTVTSQDEAADARVDRLLLIQRLNRAISQLNERSQLLLTLYYVEELTFKEIAKLLEISEARVCQLHTDGLRRLRQWLSQSLEVEQVSPMNDVV